MTLEEMNHRNACILGLLMWKVALIGRYDLVEDARQEYEDKFGKAWENDDRS